MNDDFKDYPVSVSERKADKAEDGKLWTARDALIATLRGIDDGSIKADRVVIIYDSASFMGYAQSGCTSQELLGILNHTAYKVNRNMTRD